MLLERAQKIVDKSGVPLNATDRPVDNSVNIYLVDISETDPECPLPFPQPARNSDEISLYVPVLNERLYRDPCRDRRGPARALAPRWPLDGHQ